MKKYTWVYEVVWSDTHVVVEDMNPEFGHSLHRTRKGATKEMRRMRAIDRKTARKEGGKVTTKYRVITVALFD